MSTQQPHVSSEEDRRAYQAQKNVTYLAQYLRQREQLERFKMNLAQAVMNARPQATCARLKVVIESGHRKLEEGSDLVSAIKHCYSLLEESLA